ncbi:MAG: sigma 54-interacting transcriptional regulator, partial [Desulfovibrionales bacterium]|nr:sigma 54-interacting transcriptional regulator [Desulfovibrionales bacterium]
KELIARTIHHQSPVASGPFVTVNCAAIPKYLIESELFGYEGGAFSGARSTGKKGLIETAKNGTLFLDEVGDLSLDAQAKLLRFMEEGEFYKVGSTQKQKINTRIVSATNKDLEKMVEDEAYRRDLFYRIGVIKIQLPSLNQRGEDVLVFAQYFLTRFNEKFNTQITGISPRAQALLKAHVWKGNVRELRNMMERAVLTARGSQLTPKDLGLTPQHPAPESPLSLPPLTLGGIDLNRKHQFLDEFYFTQAMELAGGNESQAARLLTLKHHTFRYQYKKLMDTRQAKDEDNS